MPLSGEITITLSFWFEAESFAKQIKTPDKFNSFQKSLLSESQEHHSLESDIPVLQFPRVPKLSIVGKQDKHSCKTSDISQMLTTCCQCS